MLLLWDRTIEPYGPVLERLGSSDLLGLSLDVVESTLRLFDPPFPGFFPPEHAELIGHVIQARSPGSGEWNFDQDFVEEILLRYDSLPEVAVRPAVGPFLMGIVRLFEAGPLSLSVDDAMEILSSCYESILMSRLTGRATLEDQENDERCSESIRLQVKAISKYQNPSEIDGSPGAA
ncbi:hypothetical protein ACIPYS_09585 [Kitasatospora sp. NPDC089913]|uniref:hypothetical protein n=1 Tax=Kitasatospora sp. NPDC089913 TaxID=3364080 RepID=UPI00382F61F3